MTPQRTFVFIACVILTAGNAKVHGQGSGLRKGDVLYENTLTDKARLSGWVMEGPGAIEIRDEWMEMFSPGQQWHHVYWCPEEFPSRIMAEWEVMNMNPVAGLLIVFFSAKGVNGEDIFDASLPERDGTFKFYTKDQLISYHISYYANNPKNPERELAHLRKNNTFSLVQTGTEGIPKRSVAIHKVTLVKDGNHIRFFIDDRKVLDWTDDGKALGPVHGGGKIGFRQMQWSHFRYRNFKVWELE